MKITLLLILSSLALVSSIATAQITVSITANRDAAIGYHDTYPTENSNYGTVDQSAAFISPGTSGGINSGRGLIDFDLSLIPSGTVIIDAKINLYALVGMNHPELDLGHLGNNASYLRRVTSAWNELAVTWNTAPTYTTNNEVILPQSTTADQDYLDIDVTDLVQDMLDNPATSHGFWLGLVDEQLPTRGLLFCSLDQGDPTKYPVLEITYACAPQTVTLSAERDAAIGYHDTYPTENSNYGTVDQSAAFISPGTSGGINSGRGLIDFDLSLIPSGTVIIDAKINLYALVGMNHPELDLGHLGNNASYLRRVTSAWNELAVTWNTAPTYTTNNEVILPQSTTADQDYLDIDVTDLVQDMLDNPATSHGFWLGLVDEQLPTRGLLFCSLDQGDPTKYPVLEITYCDSSLNVQEHIENAVISVYPNPTSGLVMLDLKHISDNQCFIAIYDSRGKLIGTEKVVQPQTNGNHSIDFGPYTNGLYFIQVSAKSGLHYVKIIKQ